MDGGSAGVAGAVQANRLYVFTDPRFQKLVKRRYERIQTDFDWAAQSTALNDAQAPGSDSAPPRS